MQAAGVLQGGLERRVQVTAALASAPAVAIYQPHRLRAMQRPPDCVQGRQNRAQKRHTVQQRRRCCLPAKHRGSAWRLLELPFGLPPPIRQINCVPFFECLAYACSNMSRARQQSSRIYLIKRGHHSSTDMNALATLATTSFPILNSLFPDPAW